VILLPRVDNSYAERRSRRINVEFVALDFCTDEQLNQALASYLAFELGERQ
jgi:hypothetical protein